MLITSSISKVAVLEFHSILEGICITSKSNMIYSFHIFIKDHQFRYSRGLINLIINQLIHSLDFITFAQVIILRIISIYEHLLMMMINSYLKDIKL